MVTGAVSDGVDRLAALRRLARLGTSVFEGRLDPVLGHVLPVFARLRSHHMRSHPLVIGFEGGLVNSEGTLLFVLSSIYLVCKSE